MVNGKAFMAKTKRMLDKAGTRVKNNFSNGAEGHGDTRNSRSGSLHTTTAAGSVVSDRYRGSRDLRGFRDEEDDENKERASAPSEDESPGSSPGENDHVVGTGRSGGMEKLMQRLREPMPTYGSANPGSNKGSRSDRGGDAGTGATRRSGAEQGGRGLPTTYARAGASKNALRESINNSEGGAYSPTGPYASAYALPAPMQQMYEGGPPREAVGGGTGGPESAEGLSPHNSHGYRHSHSHSRANRADVSSFYQMPLEDRGVATEGDEGVGSENDFMNDDDDDRRRASRNHFPSNGFIAPSFFYNAGYSREDKQGSSHYSHHLRDKTNARTGNSQYFGELNEEALHTLGGGRHSDQLGHIGGGGSSASGSQFSIGATGLPPPAQPFRWQPRHPMHHHYNHNFNSPFAGQLDNDLMRGTNPFAPSGPPMPPSQPPPQAWGGMGHEAGVPTGFSASTTQHDAAGAMEAYDYFGISLTAANVPHTLHDRRDSHYGAAEGADYATQVAHEVEEMLRTENDPLTAELSGRPDGGEAGGGPTAKPALARKLNSFYGPIGLDGMAASQRRREILENLVQRENEATRNGTLAAFEREKGAIFQLMASSTFWCDESILVDAPYVAEPNLVELDATKFEDAAPSVLNILDHTAGSPTTTTAAAAAAAAENGMNSSFSNAVAEAMDLEDHYGFGFGVGGSFGPGTLPLESPTAAATTTAATTTPVKPSSDTRSGTTKPQSVEAPRAAREAAGGADKATCPPWTLSAGRARKQVAASIGKPSHGSPSPVASPMGTAGGQGFAAGDDDDVAAAAAGGDARAGDRASADRNGKINASPPKTASQSPVRGGNISGQQKRHSTAARRGDRPRGGEMTSMANVSAVSLGNSAFFHVGYADDHNGVASPYEYGSERTTATPPKPQQQQNATPAKGRKSSAQATATGVAAAAAKQPVAATEKEKRKAPQRQAENENSGSDSDSEDNSTGSSSGSGSDSGSSGGSDGSSTDSATSGSSAVDSSPRSADATDMNEFSALAGPRRPAASPLGRPRGNNQSVSLGGAAPYMDNSIFANSAITVGGAGLSPAVSISRASVLLPPVQSPPKNKEAAGASRGRRLSSTATAAASTGARLNTQRPALTPRKGLPRDELGGMYSMGPHMRDREAPPRGSAGERKAAAQATAPSSGNTQQQGKAGGLGAGVVPYNSVDDILDSPGPTPPGPNGSKAPSTSSEASKSAAPAAGTTLSPLPAPRKAPAASSSALAPMKAGSPTSVRRMSIANASATSAAGSGTGSAVVALPPIKSSSAVPAKSATAAAAAAAASKSREGGAAAPTAVGKRAPSTNTTTTAAPATMAKPPASSSASTASGAASASAKPSTSAPSPSADVASSPRPPTFPASAKAVGARLAATKTVAPSPSPSPAGRGTAATPGAASGGAPSPSQSPQQQPQQQQQHQQKAAAGESPLNAIPERRTAKRNV